MAREAKILITSSNNAGAGIKSAITDLTSLESNTVRIAQKIQTAFSAVAVAAAAKKVVDFGIESVKAFGEVERKMTQLKVALGGNDASFDRLNKHIQNLSRVTLDSKGDIQGLVSQLAALGKSDADIERISEAAVKLSNVTGQGLNEAMKQVNATFSGTAGELSKLIPELGTLTKEQLAAGDAVDILNAKFKDVSDSMAGGVSQQLKNLTDGFGTLKENIGEKLIAAFSPMIEGINRHITAWNNAYDAHKRYKKATLDDPILAGMLKELATYEKAVFRAQGLMGSGRKDADTGEFIAAMTPEQLARETKRRDDQLAKIAAYEQVLLGANTAPIRTVSAGAGPAAPGKSAGGGPAGSSTGLPGNVTIGEYNNYPQPLGPQESEHFYGEETYSPQPAGPPSVASGPINGFQMLTDFDNLNAGLTEYGNLLEEVAASMNKQLSVSSSPIEGFQGRTDYDNLAPGLAEYGNGPAEAAAMVSYNNSPASGGDMGFDFAPGLMDAIGPVIDMFGGLLGPLASVQAIMDPIGTILGSMMEVLGPLIDEALAPLIDILKIFGKILAASLVPILNILTPVIKMVATVMEWFAKKVMVPVANFVIDIWNGIAKVLNKLLGWAGVNIGYAARIDPNSLGGGGDTGTGNTAGTGASYTGSQAITFNFYNQGNVVGSGGLEELAMIIDGLIKRNARYA